MSKNNETSSPTLKRSWVQELKSEFAKITWPTKSAVTKQSIVVMVVAILLGFIIAGLDIVIKLGLNQIIG